MTNNTPANLALLRGVLAFKMDATSNIHGAPHWCRVWENCKRLYVRMVKDPIDLEICAWFAFLHDCQRLDDYADPEHGKRAAAHALDLYHRGAIDMSQERVHMLAFAIAHHSDGIGGEEAALLPATVRVCWDADRLDLGRVNIRPDPKLMCTEPGKWIAQSLYAFPRR